LNTGSSIEQPNCSSGYGLSLKSLPMNLSADGSNQPTGQVVCG